MIDIDQYLSQEEKNLSGSTHCTQSPIEGKAYVRCEMMHSSVDEYVIVVGGALYL